MAISRRFLYIPISTARLCGSLVLLLALFHSLAPVRIAEAAQTSEKARGKAKDKDKTSPSKKTAGSGAKDKDKDKATSSKTGQSAKEKPADQRQVFGPVPTPVPGASTPVTDPVATATTAAPAPASSTTMGPVTSSTPTSHPSPASPATSGPATAHVADRDGAGADSVTDSAPSSAAPAPAPTASDSSSESAPAQKKGQQYASPDQYPTEERIPGGGANATASEDSSPSSAPTAKKAQYAAPDQYPEEERIPANHDATGGSASSAHGHTPGSGTSSESGGPLPGNGANTTTATTSTVPETPGSPARLTRTTTTSVNGTTTTTTVTSSDNSGLESPNLPAPIHKREPVARPQDLLGMLDNMAVSNRRPILRVEIHPMPSPLPPDAYYSMGIRVLFRNAPALQIATEPERGRYAPWLIPVSRFVTDNRAIVMGWSSAGPGLCTLHALAVQLTPNGRALTPTDYLRVEYAQPCGGLLLSEKEGICLLGVELPTDEAQLDGSRYFIDSVGTLLSYADLPLADTSTCTPDDGAFTRVDNLAYLTFGMPRKANVIWLDFSTGKFRTIATPSMAMTQKQAAAAALKLAAAPAKPATPGQRGKLPSLYRRTLTPAEELAEHRRIQAETVAKKNGRQLPRQEEKPKDETTVQQKGQPIPAPADMSAPYMGSPDYNANSPRGRSTGDMAPFGGGAGGVP